MIATEDNVVVEIFSINETINASKSSNLSVNKYSDSVSGFMRGRVVDIGPKVPDSWKNIISVNDIVVVDNYGVCFETRHFACVPYTEIRSKY